MLNQSNTKLQNETETKNSLSTKKMNAIFASQKHPFHILGPSTFPFFTGLLLICWLIPQIFYLHGLPLPVFNVRSDIGHLSFILLFINTMM